ncbi:response regulator [Pedobacter alpinus]|uniref:Response regulator n=1 Tax=Pedobacter alpinus TaxID=1590643 RepID=A0ABW5TTV4_9SPHI
MTKTIKKDSLSIIVLEDNEGDYILIEDNLIEIFTNVKIQRYKSYESFSKDIFWKDFKWDAILLDLNLMDIKGIELVENMVIQSSIPIIILTGYVDLPLANKSLELGVYDFLIKDEVNPALLSKSIEFAISRSSYVNQIESQNEKLKNIAWKQSHSVRAPLARILGIINMIEISDGENKDLLFWIEQLKISSNEMDSIIHQIVNETEDFNK